MAKTRVLVVEDEAAIATLLEYNLGKEDFDVIVAGDGRRRFVQDR